MSAKQDKRAKTLLEYMGFKDPDIKSNEHDEWCLRLLDDKIIKALFYSKQKIETKDSEWGWLKITNGNSITNLQCYPKYHSWDGVIEEMPCGCKIEFHYERRYDENKITFSLKEACREYQSFNWEKQQEHKAKYAQFVKICVQYQTWSLVDYFDFETMSIKAHLKINHEKYQEYDYLEITKINKQLEKVLSNHHNNFRFGFLDVYAEIYYTKHTIVVFENQTWKHIENDPHTIEMFFEVKINAPTLGEITREIEYYKDVIKTIWNISEQNIYPFVISSKKYSLPEQFDCLTFDEFNTLFPKNNQLESFE